MTYDYFNDLPSGLDGLLEGVNALVDEGAYVPSQINDQEDLEALRQALASPAVTSEEVPPEDSALTAALIEQNALLSSLVADLQSVDSTTYLFSPSSTQAQYFAGVMMGHPFWHYYAYQDSANSYTMYYGPKLQNGQKVHVIQIYRTGTNAYYNVRKEDVTYSELSGTGMVISDLYHDSARFGELDQLRFTALLAFLVVAAFGLSVLNRIFFRR